VSLYNVVWVSHAEEQFNSLSAPMRQSVMAKVGLLQRDPTSHGIYNKKADNYTTDFEYGIIMYAVVADQLTIIMLRVSAVDY
jgi:hypothetical protein